MKEKFTCDWCYEDFYGRAECGDHERCCYDNPASRSCETCVHHGDVVGDTGKVWNTCDVGLLLESVKWIENHRTQCAQWQNRYAKEGKQG